MTTLAQRLTTWRYVMNHANMPDGVEMDWFSKWLIVTRAAVFTMTATSGLIGGLLAIGTTGVLPGWVWVASLPYAILVTTVLFGKHIDKISADTAKGIHTLPVILGDVRARRVAQALMVAFYPIVIGSALVGWMGPFVLLVVLGIPQLLLVLRQFSAPRPETPPHSYVGWPLWFVGGAFRHTRRAGGLLIVGLFLNAILPGLRLPWT
jgi:1,4-dihydroxy-2-naphthoate polyprenyltransferase